MDLPAPQVYHPDQIIAATNANPQLLAQEYLCSFRVDMLLSSYIISTHRKILSKQTQTIVATFKGPNNEDLVMLKYDDGQTRYTSIDTLIIENFTAQPPKAKVGAKGRVVLKFGVIGDMNPIGKYASLVEAAASVNATSTTAICLACSGERKTAYGFKWMYESDYIADNVNVIWKPIPSSAGYEASSEGHMRNKHGLVLQENDSTGYKRCQSESLSNVSSYVHINVALAFLGPKPGDKYFVKHIDGNITNNKPSNLEWRSK